MDDLNKYFKEAEIIIDQNKRYMIRPDKLYELKEGKTDTYLATKVPCARTYLNEIFTGRRTVIKKTLLKILKPICSESVKLFNMCKTKGIDYVINYFFEEI